MSRAGEKIKELRMEAGFTQKALAKKLGVSESFLNDVENGRKVVNESIIMRISKILNKNINDISMIEDEEREETESLPTKASYGNLNKKSSSANKEVNEVWASAFSSVLKEIPIYDYSLSKVLGKKVLPIENNKIEGYAQDKVLYIKIEQDDMIGYRIKAGDIAFGHYTSELDSGAIYLFEHNGKRNIRQIKRLDSTKLLLIGNQGSILTETVNVKEIKLIAKLEKVEFPL
ncbi:helix-turn-helix domain-containing protein [Clostridium oryzae]|uniref:Anaerobic benzoate catabolism transcriptional regulator n=1 Tax=Clostridium oryzae TaxID=1450648 RepID=A0A1V4IT88_9CLOT|nr:helix-turn-helix domain-containing protein [Clostridium oryzae]OPJ63030.1 anaerobic benzoate catabolism transcriptional regulator [Clostridium oryzae]